MATLTRRRVGGRTYFYGVRCGRVHGKPRLVWQKFLGTADDIIERLLTQEARSLPESSQVRRFGLEAACLQIAEELGIVTTLNQYLPKRSQGLSPGDYLLIAAINRCCAPASKRGISGWFFDSILAHHYAQVKPADLASQRFWDHMGMVNEPALTQIETALSRRLIERCHPDLETLIYDTTNFYTYISSFNERCPIAQRGHNKQKRYDLRQVNLALMVTRDGHLPLFHYCYEGNRADCESFQTIVEQLTGRLAQIAPGGQEVTLVYDTGNNSEAAVTRLATTPYHSISGLPISYRPDLLDVPTERYRPLAGERFNGVRVYREEREILGRNSTVLVVFSANFYQDQYQTVLGMAAKAMGKLQVLKDRLALWANGTYRNGRLPTVDTVTKKVKEIRKGQYLEELIAVTVETGGRFVQLSFKLNAVYLATLADRVFGKSILFTDHGDWTDEAIVGSYWDKWEVEAAFRQMKDRNHCSWFPMYHWTPSKIKVHALCCTLALLITSLLHWRVRKAGIELGSEELMEALSGIHQINYRYAQQGKGRRKQHTTLTERNGIQQRLLETLDLAKYC